MVHHPRFEEGAFTDAQVVLTQEHKLLTDETIRTASEKLQQLGWKSVFSKALTTEASAASGGVAIAIRDGLDIGISPRQCGCTPHRLLTDL